MKIPASIRRLHQDQEEVNNRLKAVIDVRMLGLRSRRWHYESRVKNLVSFALKIESGRFRRPEALEDFFACTIVVANANEITEAEGLIRDNFTVKERRPSHAGRTHKTSDAFPFDDLRLYVTLREEPAAPPTDLFGVLFEVQIKTFLQHAWVIATHDLLYKSDDPNWSKERIAYQIKAMLEHAEVSIQEADTLAASSALAKEDRQVRTIKEGVALLKSQWSIDELPKDLRQLAMNINEVIEALGLNVARLEEILKLGKQERGGDHPSNLSPYATVIKYLLVAERERMMSLLRGSKGRTKVLLSEEIELPPDIDRARLRNAVFVTAGAGALQTGEPELA
jgi:ppGpp synthetase/RelA/SpoT-type nucleotidyltranferase